MYSRRKDFSWWSLENELYALFEEDPEKYKRMVTLIRDAERLREKTPPLRQVLDSVEDRLVQQGKL